MMQRYNQDWEFEPSRMIKGENGPWVLFDEASSVIDKLKDDHLFTLAEKEAGIAELTRQRDLCLTTMELDDKDHTEDHENIERLEAEVVSLKQDLALNAKMLAHQTDLVREAETEAGKQNYCGEGPKMTDLCDREKWEEEDETKAY